MIVLQVGLGNCCGAQAEIRRAVNHAVRTWFPKAECVVQGGLLLRLTNFVLDQAPVRWALLVG
jgi:hypothetical protein